MLKLHIQLNRVVFRFVHAIENYFITSFKSNKTRYNKLLLKRQYTNYH